MRAAVQGWLYGVAQLRHLQAAARCDRPAPGGAAGTWLIRPGPSARSASEWPRVDPRRQRPPCAAGAPAWADRPAATPVVTERPFQRWLGGGALPIAAARGGVPRQPGGPRVGDV